MKVSVLIANYNNGKYFRDCYDSIIAQSHKDWEVIIVDDCSTDDSVSAIKNIIGDDSRFQLILNKENRGCGYTKNRTLQYATGEICTFLDPDDAITPDALEISLNKYTQEKIIATYSRIMFCDENLVPQYDFKQIKQVHNDRFFFNAPTQINALFTFRKKIYDKTSGIDKDLHSAVDQDLYLKLLEHGDPKYIPKNLYLYRRHSAGISQDKSKNKAKENFAKVIFNTFKRRNITKINGTEIPKEYPGSEKIFQLLEYQNGIPYRIKKKMKIMLQNFF